MHIKQTKLAIAVTDYTIYNKNYKTNMQQRYFPKLAL